MRTPVILSVAAGALLTLWVGWGLYGIYSTERPPYQVVEALSPQVEIRQYEEQTWVTTAYESDDAAFPVLASYIFGGNQEDERIAMTAPVITDSAMAFILPGTLSQSTAPAPDGQAVDFVTVPARKLATLQFSWWTPPSRVEQKTAELLRLLRQENVATTGQPFLMRYNDPWTPPFLRRNEVAIEVL
ncbi:MAG: heme-binding protein [Rhodothermales bacterium]|nr:heme-binding protein [Rhodothermales bacterium]